MMDARQIAARTLLSLERRDAWSNLSLGHALDSHELEPARAAFAAALFYGVIERRLTLDACIARHSSKPPEKLDPVVLCALRTGIFQLLYMDGVPESAAVNESVSLAGKMKRGHASGFVNAVLRSFLRSGKEIPLPEGPLSARLSVEYSCPEPLVSEWLVNYGEEAVRRFLADSLGKPPAAIRTNTLRTTSDELISLLEKQGVSATVHPNLPDCLLLESSAPQKLEAFRQGLFHLQDPASQLCVEALDVRPGMRVLDACSAPGGKAFTLAQKLRGQGEVVACDIREKRVGLIKKRAAELKIQGINALCRDMSLPHRDLGSFDRVLCDVPCSGYGVIRRKPEIKYKPPGDFEDIPNLQYKILENSSQYCRAGGVLVYSTCTLNRAENQEVTARFLDSYPEFCPLPLDYVAGDILGDGWARTLVGEFGADGFYISAFARRDELC